MIRMIKTMNGSPDGITVLEYKAGETYPRPDAPTGPELEAVFVREGWAEEAEDTSDISSLKVAELKALLTEKGIEFKPNATKAELIALLNEGAGGES